MRQSHKERLMGPDDWGVLEWLVAAVPFVVPAVVVLRLARYPATQIQYEDTGLRRALGWAWLVAKCLAGYVFGMLLLLGFFADAYFSARMAARSSTCREHLRQLSSAVMMYASAWDDTLPPAPHWGDLASGYLPADEARSAFQCPSARSPFAYALNRSLGGVPLSRIEAPDTTVLLLEHDAASRNEVGGRNSLPALPRHSTNHVSLAGGSVRWISSERAGALIWDVPNAAETEKARAVSAAEYVVYNRELWLERVTSEARRTDFGWMVTVRRIDGRRPDGKPRYMPSGYRRVVLDRMLNVVGYVRHQ
jgi:hypothetical protein